MKDARSAKVPVGRERDHESFGHGDDALATALRRVLDPSPGSETDAELAVTKVDVGLAKRDDLAALQPASPPRSTIVRTRKERPATSRTLQPDDRLLPQLDLHPVQLPPFPPLQK